MFEKSGPTVIEVIYKVVKIRLIRQNLEKLQFCKASNDNTSIITRNQELN